MRQIVLKYVRLNLKNFIHWKIPYMGAQSQTLVLVVVQKALLTTPFSGLIGSVLFCASWPQPVLLLHHFCQLLLSYVVEHFI